AKKNAQPRRPTRKWRNRRQRNKQGKRNNPKKTGEKTRTPANAVGKPATEWTRQRCQDHKARRSKPRVGRGKAELVFQQHRKVDRKRNESSERQKIEERQKPAQSLPRQQPQHLAKPRRPDRFRRVPSN